MIHENPAIVDSFTQETPKPSFSHLPSTFTPNTISTNHTNHARPPVVIEWDWNLEHADRKREAKADSAIHGAQPFIVDRNILRDVIKEKLDSRVGRITFLSSGVCRPLLSRQSPS
jgi:hypothetical protein